MALTTYDYNVYIMICQPHRMETCAYGFWAKNNILIPETRINKGFRFLKKQKFAYSAQTQVRVFPSCASSTENTKQETMEGIVFQS